MRKLSAHPVAVALLGALSASPSLADDAERTANADRGSVVHAEAQLLIVTQDGNSGYQSQAGPYDGPGSERALIIQPSGLVTFEQEPGVEWELATTVDIVSAASANAVDATSIASALNEAVDFSVDTSIDLGSETTFRSGLAFHLEEPLRSTRYQVGLDRSLGQGSASLGASAGMVLDFLDNHLPNGKSRTGDLKTRAAYNLNLSFSQILSPTTVFIAGYGFTHQRGTLSTPWNSVPLSGGIEGPAVRGGERFPDQRNRHAATVELAQHVPFTRSTFRLDYRYYVDDFEIAAHNAQLSYYQYLGPDLLVRTHYRFYVQSAASFFGKSFPQTLEVTEEDITHARPWAFRPAILQTSDSDLDHFVAHEVGGEISWLQLNDNSVDLSYTYYARSNGLAAHLFFLGYVALY